MNLKRGVRRMNGGLKRTAAILGVLTGIAAATAGYVHDSGRQAERIDANTEAIRKTRADMNHRFERMEDDTQHQLDRIEDNVNEIRKFLMEDSR